MTEIKYEPGFFWARAKDFKWNNIILRIYGNAPFLTWKSWHMDIMHDEISYGSGTPPYEIRGKIEEAK